MTIKLILQGTVSDIPDSIYGMDVLSYEDNTLTLLKDEDLTTAGHIKKVQRFFGNEVQVSLAPETTTKSVWESVFAKPDPVYDLEEWEASLESDEYIYLPNNMQMPDGRLESVVLNARFTEVLTNAYREMCRAQGINPTVRIVQGATLACWHVTPQQGCQPNVPDEISARLANSKLYGFDDSQYAQAFLDHIAKLTPDQYESPAIRHFVLAKAEYILLGTTKKKTNQKFMEEFSKAVGDEHIGKLQANLRFMVTNGMVLQESDNAFELSLVRGRLDKSLLKQVMRIYRQVCGGA
jgi:hypothetical protein